MKTNLNKLLVECDFNNHIAQTTPSTQTGLDLVNKYKSFLMNNNSSFNLINSFVKEAANCRYDNGINVLLNDVSKCINDNKVSWALATQCENINSHDNSSYNFLNKNAASQVEKLLEMEENDVVNYIKAGALKSVMFCESFRNIISQVYKESPVVESYVDYDKINPISIVESVGDGYCFEVNGLVFKIDDDKNIQESNWNEVSNTFKTISSVLESDSCVIDRGDIKVNISETINFTIDKSNHIVKESKLGKEKFTVEQLRDNNRFTLSVINPRKRNSVAALLEGVALIAENYDNIVSLDNVNIYETKNDKFLVIEGDGKLYATLLNSNHTPRWTVNEGVMDTLTFITQKTNVTISEDYTEQTRKEIENISESEKEQIEEDLHAQSIKGLTERIELLTEKFKNDPIKLAVISKLAQDIHNN